MAQNMSMILKTANLRKAFSGHTAVNNLSFIRSTTALLAAFVVCFSMTGCSLQDKIEEYSKDKEQCNLNTGNVTQFSYKGVSYTILEDTVTNDGLGEWVGYIRRLTAVDEAGKVLLQ